MSAESAPLKSPDKPIEPGIDVAGLEKIKSEQAAVRQADKILADEHVRLAREARLQRLAGQIQASETSHLIKPEKRDEFLKLYKEHGTKAFDMIAPGYQEESKPTINPDTQARQQASVHQIEQNRADAPAPSTIRETKQDWAA